MGASYRRPPPRWYLWHLERVGVVSLGDGEVSAPLWDAAADEKPVQVAIIDTGLDPGHPNLLGAVRTLQIDYGPRPEGLIYRPRFHLAGALRNEIGLVPAAQLPELVRRATQEVNDLARQFGEAEETTSALQQEIAAHAAAEADAEENADPTTAANEKKTAEDTAEEAAGQLEEAVERLSAVPEALEAPSGYATFLSALKGRLSSDAQKRVADTLAGFPMPEVNATALPDPSTFFGVHGTSTAGLVGGRPAPAALGGPGKAIRYYGVNPFCQIRSYATPISHEIRPVINALIHAYFSGAEVICMPRAVSDPVERAKDMEGSPYTTRIDGDTESIVVNNAVVWQPVEEDQAVLSRLKNDKAIFEALLKMISLERIVVLAAGNDGNPKKFAYPASIAAADDNIVVVGARNDIGLVSTYSSGSDASPAPLYMLSDDAERLDRQVRSIDRSAMVAADLDLSVHPSRSEREYSPWGILGLDVRGAYGRAGDDEDQQDDDPGTDLSELYTIFGGTSAASAMMAGLASLLIQSGKIQRGPLSREDLRSAIRPYYGPV